MRRAIKVAGAVLLAVGAAKLIGLDNATSVATITILTILETRQASLKKALHYLLGLAIGFVVFTLCFKLGGIQFWSYGVGLLLYTLIADRIEISSTIPSIAMLMTHFVNANSLAPYWYYNEAMILILAVTSANIWNFWMPSYFVKIKETIQSVEDQMRAILIEMGDEVSKYDTLADEPVFYEDDSLFHQIHALEGQLEQLSATAYLEYNNQILKKNSYFVEYAQMRMEQIPVLMSIYQSLTQLDLSYEATQMLAEILYEAADELDELNTGQDLLLRMAEFSQGFHESPLPQTKREFESQAILYHLLIRIEDLIELKHHFYQLQLAEDNDVNLPY